MKTNITIQDILSRPCGHRNKHLVAEPVKKKSKYGNVRVEFDGLWFDSQKERNRYINLRMRQVAGEIKDLACQVEFILESENKKACSYFADFVYTDVKTGAIVVEDVKSKATKTALYRLKKKLMALKGIEIKEV